jgi:ribosomal protein S18 acetylase RimI-like enzyme
MQIRILEHSKYHGLQGPARTGTRDLGAGRYHAMVSARFGDHLWQRLKESLEDSSTRSWLAWDRGELCALAILKSLPWDTALLGIACARIEHLVAKGEYKDQRSYLMRLLEAIQDSCLQQKIRHISVRVGSDELPKLHALETAGFITVDAILTYGRTISSIKPSPNEGRFDVRMATQEDLDQVAGLARTSFTFDRFHSDPEIPSAAADKLHEAWAKNSVMGRVSDAVLVGEDEQGIAGFITCRIDPASRISAEGSVGTIILIAVASRARGLGLGMQLTSSAVEWFAQRRVSRAEVGTQLRNVPASRLYQAAGFKLLGTSVSLRKVIGD